MKIAFVLAAALCLAGASSAGAAPPPKAASSPAQVDGIVSAAVDRLWDQTDRYWHLGDYPRIIALDRIITQADPHFVESYATGGWLMWSLGLRKDAEAFYQEGVRNNPDVSYAYYNLGFFYYNTLHDYPAAVQVFRKDVTLRDADLNDWKMLAHSYEKMHDYDAAVATWRKIKSRWPNGVAVDVNLNRALALQKAAHAATSVPPAQTGKNPL